MQIGNELAEAINDQINFELYSGYIYLAMSAWFEEKKLPGMAHWMNMQADEEYIHAKKLWTHVVERGGRVTMKAIAGPKNEWDSPMDAFKDALHHEETVTKRIYKLGDIADNEKDRAAQSMLRWFYDEQVEEEASVQEVLDQLEMIGDSVQALFMVDQKLGARPAPTPPVEE